MPTALTSGNVKNEISYNVSKDVNLILHGKKDGAVVKNYYLQNMVFRALNSHPYIVYKLHFTTVPSYFFFWPLRSASFPKRLNQFWGSESPNTIPNTIAPAILKVSIPFSVL